MKVRPLADRVLVEVLEAEAKTKGGIILPDTAKEEKTEGKVIAVGTGKVLESGKVQAIEVKKGDRVLFGKYSGDDLVIDGTKPPMASSTCGSRNAPIFTGTSGARRSACPGANKAAAGRPAAPLVTIPVS